MAYVLNLSNTTQSNFITVTVNAVPAAPDDLVWTPGGTGLTLNGLPGTIFPNITGDQVAPPFWYHGGNPKIPATAIQVHSLNNIVATNSSPTVISGQFQKGIFELRQTTPNVITNISQALNAQITTSANHNFVVGDKVEITGVLGIVPPGIYKVTAIVNATNFSIDFNSLSTPNTLTSAAVTLHNYYWDEVYTTPLGLYNARDTSIPNPGFYEFKVTNNNSDELVLYVNDPNIIPKVGDSMTIQRFFQHEYSFTNQPTTDGLNHVVNFSESETYEFKIVAVSSIINPLGLVNPYIEYTLTLDKSFTTIVNAGAPYEKYMMVLLNRAGTTPDRELFTDTWNLTEVHRSQLLGDPYNFIGASQPQGRKNYLNYLGAELLGIQNLLAGVIPAAGTPFIVLDFADEIKDRIYNNVGEFEIHLPTLMIQGERTPVILTNSNPYALVNPVLTDANGAGDYSPLYLKYPGISPAVRYGFVMYDLRIVVIDHLELAAAMGYNTNRNYTLPAPTLPTTGNTIARPTKTNPIVITGASNTTPIQITSATHHAFVTGDEVIISGVLGNTAANNSVTTPKFFVQVISPTTFNIYNDSLFGSPVVSNAPYTGGGIFYGLRLPFEYFYTYRMKEKANASDFGAPYNTLPYIDLTPFNWQLSGSLDDTTAAKLDTHFDFLTHLVDYDAVNNTGGNREGFLADNYEIIIGAFTPSLIDTTVIAGIQDVVVMPFLSLKDPLQLPNILSAQNLQHNATFTRNTYNIVVTQANLMANNNPNNPKYDLLNVDVQKIYNLLSTPLPSTLFTSEGRWTIGLLKYKAEQNQYRLTFTVTVPAGNWNGTQNPSFNPGDPLQSDKLISEIEFLIQDAVGNIVDSPYIYAKISPPLKKNNTNDLIIQVELDF